MTTDCTIKLIVLGECGVGKTSLLLQFTKSSDLLKPTVIIDRLHSTLTVHNKVVHLELWDTGGQERFRSIVKKFYRNADGVLLVYDVTNMESFLSLSSWLLELKEQNTSPVSIIVGNKIDDPNRNAVSFNQVKRFAEEENMELFESSAKTGENVHQIFERLTLRVLESKQIIPKLEPLSKQLEPSEENVLSKSSEQIEDSEEAILSTYSVIPKVTAEDETDNITLQDTSVSVKKKKNCSL